MKKRFFSVFFATLLLLGVILTPVASAITYDIYVGDNGYSSLASAVAAAAANDEIIIDNLPTLEEDVIIDKPLTIDGGGAELEGSITLAAEDVVIRDLYFIGDGTGAAVNVSADVATSLSLNSCDISGYEYGVYSPSINGVGFSITLLRCNFATCTVSPVFACNLVYGSFARTTFTGPAATAVDLDFVGVTCTGVTFNRCTFTDFGDVADETTAAVTVAARGGAADRAFATKELASVTALTFTNSAFIGEAADVVTGFGFIGTTHVSIIDSGDNTGLNTIIDNANRIPLTADVKLVPASEFADDPVFNEINLDGIDYDPEFSVGAVFQIVDQGRGYDNWSVDFILNVNQSVNAKLYGYYGGWGWLGRDMTVPSGDTRILESAGFDRVQVYEVAESVITFYCVFLADRATITGDLDVSLTLRAFDPVDDTITVDPITTSSSDTILFSATSTLPTASVDMVSGADFATTDVFDEIQDSFEFDTNYALGARFSLADAGENFNNWEVGFDLTTNMPIRAKLIGSYTGTYGGNVTNYEWQGTEDYVEIPAGTMDVVAAMVGGIPVSQLVHANIEDFYCALIIDQTSLDGALNVSLDITLNEPILDAPRKYQIPVTQTSDDVSSVFESALPDIASVKYTADDFLADSVLSTLTEPFDEEYVIGGTVTLSDKGIDYDDWKLGAEVTFTGDEAVKAKFMGKAPDADWVSRTGAYRYYTSANVCKVFFANASSTISSFDDGYAYSYAFVVDREELYGIMGVTVQTYLYSDDGLYKIEVGTPITVDMTVASPSGSFSALTADDLNADSEFAALAGTVADEYLLASRYVLNSKGMGYNDYYIDIDVTATGSNVKARLFVNYSDCGWVDAGITELAVGNSVKLIDNADKTVVQELEEVNSTITVVLQVLESSVLQNARLSLRARLYEPVTVTNPVSVPLGAAISKDVLRRQVEMLPEAEVAQLVFAGDTPATLTQVLTYQNALPIGSTVSFVDKTGEAIPETAKVGTGSVVKIEFGAAVTEYTVVIFGDIDGDGDITNEDFSESVMAVVGAVELDEPNMRAADANNNGVLDSLDAMLQELYRSGHMTADDLISLRR